MTIFFALITAFILSGCFVPSRKFKSDIVASQRDEESPGDSLTIERSDELGCEGGKTNFCIPKFMQTTLFDKIDQDEKLKGSLVSLLSKNDLRKGTASSSINTNDLTEGESEIIKELVKIKSEKKFGKYFVDAFIRPCSELVLFFQEKSIPLKMVEDIIRVKLSGIQGAQTIKEQVKLLVKQVKEKLEQKTQGILQNKDFIEFISPKIQSELYKKIVEMDLEKDLFEALCNSKLIPFFFYKIGSYHFSEKDLMELVNSFQLNQSKTKGQLRILKSFIISSELITTLQVTDAAEITKQLNQLRLPANCDKAVSELINKDVSKLKKILKQHHPSNGKQTKKQVHF